MYSPSACIQRTLRAARETSFPLERLTFEITEDEANRIVERIRRSVTGGS